MPIRLRCGWAFIDEEIQDLKSRAACCRDLLDEAKDYHLMPERRSLLQTFKTRPRCCTDVVGVIYAVGGLTSSGGWGGGHILGYLHGGGGAHVLRYLGDGGGLLTSSGTGIYVTKRTFPFTGLYSFAGTTSNTGTRSFEKFANCDQKYFWQESSQ